MTVCKCYPHTFQIYPVKGKTTETAKRSVVAMSARGEQLKHRDSQGDTVLSDSVLLDMWHHARSKTQNYMTQRVSLDGCKPKENHLGGEGIPGRNRNMTRESNCITNVRSGSLHSLHSYSYSYSYSLQMSGSGWEGKGAGLSNLWVQKNEGKSKSAISTVFCLIKLFYMRLGVNNWYIDNTDTHVL